MTDKRMILTLEEHIHIINEQKNEKSERKMAQMFNDGKTQINKTLKNKEVRMASQ